MSKLEAARMFAEAALRSLQLRTIDNLWPPELFVFTGSYNDRIYPDHDVSWSRDVQTTTGGLSFGGVNVIVSNTVPENAMFMVNRNAFMLNTGDTLTAAIGVSITP